MAGRRPSLDLARWSSRFASIRWRLTLLYTGMLTVALIVFGGVVYGWQTANLRQQINGEIHVLEQQAGNMAVVAAAGFGAGEAGTIAVADPPASVGAPRLDFRIGGAPSAPGPMTIGPASGVETAGSTTIVSGAVRTLVGGPDAAGIPGPMLPPPVSSDVALIVGPEGEIIEQAGPLSDDDLRRVVTEAVPVLPGQGEKTGGVAFAVPQLISGATATTTDYQFYATSIPAGDGGVRTVILGRPNPALGQLRSLTLTLLGAGAATLFVASAGGYWLATRALHPVHAITQTAREIGETDLSRRLNLTNRDELGELAATFDAMLARLEAAFHRQRQFTNDASHELRTPLTIVRLEIERALSRPGLPPEQAQALGTIRTETEHMGRLVNDLLVLARADADRALPGRTVVDLADLALEVVERLAPLARLQGIELGVGDLPELPVAGNRLVLTQMLSNLVENAITYTAGHGRHVAVAAGRDATGREAWGWVRVTDSGRGIPAEHLPHLFDRFYRVDQARAGDGGDGIDSAPRGSGLGLAIVHWAAKAHGGEVRVASEVGRGSAFEVRLPLTRVMGDG